MIHAWTLYSLHCLYPGEEQLLSMLVVYTVSMKANAKCACMTTPICMSRCCHVCSISVVVVMRQWGIRSCCPPVPCRDGRLKCRCLLIPDGKMTMRPACVVWSVTAWMLRWPIFLCTLHEQLRQRPRESKGPEVPVRHSCIGVWRLSRKQQDSSSSTPSCPSPLTVGAKWKWTYCGQRAVSQSNWTVRSIWPILMPTVGIDARMFSYRKMATSSYGFSLKMLANIWILYWIPSCAQ